MGACKKQPEFGRSELKASTAAEDRVNGIDDSAYREYILR